MRRPNKANKDKFIEAAVKELEEHGVSDFSLRRVAKSCGVSCAAPYKHFESKGELMTEVIRHINRKWLDIRESTDALHENESLKNRIVAICMAYVTFLCTYPEYQTILNMNDRVFPSEMLEEKGKVSSQTEMLINEYCTQENMAEDVKRRKLFVVRSLLFGASIMINSGQLPFNTDTLDMVKSNILREFEIE